MLQQQIAKKREELGRALKQAQELGKASNEKPEDGPAKEAFEKAYKDTAKLTTELRQLEQQAEIEQQAKDWATPDRKSVV